MSAVLAYITRHNAEDGYAVYLVDMPNTLLADEESIKTLFGDSIPMTYAEGVVIYLYDSRPPSAFRERIQADVVIDIERLQGSPGRQRWTSSPIPTSLPPSILSSSTRADPLIVDPRHSLLDSHPQRCRLHMYILSAADCICPPPFH